MTATLAGGEDTLPAIAVPQAVSENQRGEVLLTPYSRQLTTGGGKPGHRWSDLRGRVAAGVNMTRTPVES